MCDFLAPTTLTRPRVVVVQDTALSAADMQRIKDDTVDAATEQGLQVGWVDLLNKWGEKKEVMWMRDASTGEEDSLSHKWVVQAQWLGAGLGMDLRWGKTKAVRMPNTKEEMQVFKAYLRAVGILVGNASKFTKVTAKVAIGAAKQICIKAKGGGSSPMLQLLTDASVALKEALPSGTPAQHSRAAVAAAELAKQRLIQERADAAKLCAHQAARLAFERAAGALHVGRKDSHQGCSSSQRPAAAAEGCDMGPAYEEEAATELEAGQSTWEAGLSTGAGEDHQQEAGFPTWAAGPHLSGSGPPLAEDPLEIVYHPPAAASMDVAGELLVGSGFSESSLFLEFPGGEPCAGEALMPYCIAAALRAVARIPDEVPLPHGKNVLNDLLMIPTESELVKLLMHLLRVVQKSKLWVGEPVQLHLLKQMNNPKVRGTENHY